MRGKELAVGEDAADGAEDRAAPRVAASPVSDGIAFTLILLGSEVKAHRGGSL